MYITKDDHVLTERCRHDEIRSLYADQLAYAWMEDSTTETTRASVDEKVDSFAEGDLGYAKEIISALWEIANKDDDTKAPANTPSTVSPFEFSLLADVMRSAHFTHLMPPGRAGHEPRTLGRCEDCAYQIDSPRCLLRQEVLG